MPIRRRGTRRARRTSHRQNNNTDFSLLPSYEGRHDESYDAKGVSIFQSTPLMRRETCGFIQITLLLSISIHSPHARGDDVGDHESGYRRYFNPLPSCEGRRKWCRHEWPPEQFQSTPLMRGETDSPVIPPSQTRYFNPLPSCEGRRINRH